MGTRNQHPGNGTTVLRSLATANPPLYVTQQQAYELYTRLFRLGPEEEAFYRRLLLGDTIKGRFIGMDSTEEAIEADPDALNARFLLHARRTAAAAARDALSRAGLGAESVGALVVNTCTGYLCPGLSSYLAEDLHLPHDIRTLDITGMGCGAALPNLESTAGLLQVDNRRPALSVAVEICSSTLFMGPDPALIVSNSIFGDGAAASVLIADNNDADTIAPAKIAGFSSIVHPEFRELLRYRQEGGRLRNYLSIKVPRIGAKLAGKALDQLLEPRRLRRSDIRWWAVHAGGTAVLDRVGELLGIDSAGLQFSREVFENYGNMSSPSVLFGLDSILRNGKPAAGDLGVLLAFGAGFSAFAALIEFTGVTA